MKNLLILTFLFLATMANAQFGDSANQNTLRFSTDSGEQELVVPLGTIFSEKGGQLNFTLPAGVTLTAINSSGGTAARATGGGSLTCKCESGSGVCTPALTKQTAGCNTKLDNPCNKCNGTLSSVATPGNFSQKGDIVAYSITVSANKFEATQLSSYSTENISLWQKSDWISTNELNRALKSDPRLNRVFKAVEKSKSTDKKVHALVLISGKKALLEIPASLAGGGVSYIGTSTGGSSVTCTGCNGSCYVKSEYFGKLKYCEGCDSGCTISWSR